MSYILPDATIEQLLQEHGSPVSQENYLKEIGFEGMIDRLGTGGIVRTRELIQWGHILAWCTRDQEARFQSIHEWRSPRSESEAPGFRFPKIGPLFVMRAVLGLFLPNELSGEERLAELQRQQEKLNKTLEEKKREPVFRVNLYELELRNKLAEIFPAIRDLDERPFKSDKLVPEDLKRMTSRAMQQLQAVIQKRVQEEKHQQDLVDDLTGSIKQQQGELERLDTVSLLIKGSIDEIIRGGSPLADQQQKLSEYLNRKCPLGKVLVRECEHVKQLQKLLELKDIHDSRALVQAKEILNQELQKIEAEKAELSRLLDRLIGERKQAAEKRDAISKERHEKVNELQSLKSVQDNLELWLAKRDRPGGYDELDRLRQELAEIDQNIVLIEKELSDLLSRHSKNRELLSTIFSAAVRSVLRSGTYDGVVKFTNRDLDFRITHGHSMTGEAVETLAVLLSDVSCLIYSAQAKAAVLPGFFLHDSPREADLGKRLYYSFIRFVAAFQEQFGSAENCPFQYVLTTTTAPPEELKSDRHVRLRLNAAKADELLFRRNFAEPLDRHPLLWPRKEG